MPAKRTPLSDLASFRYTPVKLACSTKRGVASQPVGSSRSPSPQEKVDYAKSKEPATRLVVTLSALVTYGYFDEGDIYYPLARSERDAFRTKAGKRVPPHHWAVYDLIRSIPAGKVSTYKDVCAALGEGSPRSVGGALRNNPFAPRIPCHRVIASSFFVGGFKGQWTAPARQLSGSADAAKKDGENMKNWHEPFRGAGLGALQNEKVRMLVCEGVGFGKDGKMLVSQDAVWKFDSSQDADE